MTDVAILTKNVKPAAALGGYLLVLLGFGLGSSPIALLAQPTPDTAGVRAFVAWAKGAVQPLSPDHRLTSASRAGFMQLTRDATVVGLGESAHDVHDFLLLHRDLTFELMSHNRVAAVVLESGLAEGRGIETWIDGESDVVPDFARDLSYGWGDQTELIDALRLIREHNKRVLPKLRIHFYGMDMPADGGGSLVPALEPVWAFLDRVDPAFARESRARLEPLADAVASTGYGIVSRYASLGTRRDTLHRGVRALVERFRAHGREYTHRSSRDDFAWASRLADVALQTETAVRVGWNDASNPRDVAMASNVEWILAREGARGKVVVWSHNLHVARSPIAGPLYAGRGGASAVTSMGELLGRALGRAYAPIGTAFGQDAAGTSPDPQSVDGILRQIRRAPFLLNLTVAPRDVSISRWLESPHAMRAESGYVVTRPGRAFDGLVYFDSVRASEHFHH